MLHCHRCHQNGGFCGHSLILCALSDYHQEISTDLEEDRQCCRWQTPKVMYRARGGICFEQKLKYTKEGFSVSFDGGNQYRWSEKDLPISVQLSSTCPKHPLFLSVASGCTHPPNLCPGREGVLSAKSQHRLFLRDDPLKSFVQRVDRYRPIANKDKNKDQHLWFKIFMFLVTTLFITAVIMALIYLLIHKIRPSWLHL